MSDDVPVVDLDGDPRRVAAELGAAFEAIGFAQVVGHGVPRAVADAAWDAAGAFFDLPLDARMAVRTEPGAAYGFVPVAGEALTRSVDGDERAEGAATPDLKQTFNAGPVDPLRRPPLDAGEAWAFAPTPWPAALPELRATWEPCWRELLALSTRLMQLVALALDLPRTWFDAMIDESPSALRAIDYPHQSTPPPPGQLRAGAHTDYGTLTLLRQDDAPGGLEVLDRSGRWTAVAAVDGALVVNVGDLLARWTDDRWRSTLHRVVNPPAGAAGSTRRRSMAFFHNANWAAEVRCLPTCTPASGRPRHAPVVAGPHLMAKYHRAVGA